MVVEPLQIPVQVGAGIEPPERRGSGVVTLREPRQAVFDRPEIGEVIESKNLTLHDGEVDFDLIEPRRIHRGMDNHRVRIPLRPPIDRGLPTVRGTVVDNRRTRAGPTRTARVS